MELYNRLCTITKQENVRRRGHQLRNIGHKSRNQRTAADDNFEELTGYSKEDIENNIITQIDLIPDEDKTEYLCQVNANLAKSTFVFQEHKIHRKDPGAQRSGLTC